MNQTHRGAAHRRVVCLRHTFFSVSSPAEGRSIPVPRIENGCFHQNGLVNGLVHNLLMQFFTLIQFLDWGLEAPSNFWQPNFLP